MLYTLAEWMDLEYKRNWSKPTEKLAFHNIHFIKHSITKTVYEIQTITNYIIKTIYFKLYIIIYYSKYVALKYFDW